MFQFKLRIQQTQTFESFEKWRIGGQVYSGLPEPQCRTFVQTTKVVVHWEDSFICTIWKITNCEHPDFASRNSHMNVRGAETTVKLFWPVKCNFHGSFLNVFTCESVHTFLKDDSSLCIQVQEYPPHQASTTCHDQGSNLSKHYVKSKHLVMLLTANCKEQKFLSIAGLNECLSELEKSNPIYFTLHSYMMRSKRSEQAQELCFTFPNYTKNDHAHCSLRGDWRTLKR